MIRLTSVRLKKGISNPLFTESPTAYESDNANQYEIRKIGDSVVVGAPAWDNKVLVIPWSEVEGAHSTWDDVIPANDNALVAPVAPKAKAAGKK